ncbi:SLAP domain-containing protein [Clostridium sp. MSJ-4]|uniref:SLAP domain-containing protein n=1 Tax=Clostridium simiarum TaxID=2841506 RepID=A0ABS6F284_9CLOT|nr:SLAP domain-containing protein [Clostridium simiarum]MBU5592495.1 SLAP domain-containing protein [Clostridium simiarum]
MDNIKLNLHITGVSTDAMDIKRKEFLLNELKKLGEKHPISEGEIFIDTTHVKFYEDNIIKVTFFIRNATSTALSISNIPVNIVSSDGEVISLRAFQLNKPIKVEAYSASPYKIEIDKSQYEEIIDEKLTISVDSILGVRY